MWQAISAQALMSATGGFLSYRASNKRYKAHKRWTEYQNRLRMISSAVNQNKMSLRENFVVAESADRSIAIKRNRIRASGAARVAAATAGVTGGSVGEVMLGIERNAANAESKRKQSLRDELLNIDSIRAADVTGAAAGMAMSPTNAPSVGATLMGIGTDVFRSGVLDNLWKTAPGVLPENDNWQNKNILNALSF